MCGQFGQGWPELPSAVIVAAEHAVRFQTGRKSMGGRAGETGAFAEFAERTGRLGNRVEHSHGFVENADAAILSHI